MRRIRWSKLHDALARETSGGRLIPQIDGLRFVAVMSVLLYHINGYTLEACSRGRDPSALQDPAYRVLATGYFGVQLFFAISGFILGLPFAAGWLGLRKRPALGAYFLRRVTRLEPPYIINLGAAAAIAIVLGKLGFWVALGHLLASIFYVHYFVFHGGSLINGVAWSLEVEVQFYVLAPVLSAVFAIRNTAARRVVIGGGMVLAGACQQFSGLDLAHGWTLLNQLHYFLCGFMLVDLYLNEFREPVRRGLLWDVAGVAAWGGIAGLLVFRAGPDPIPGDGLIHVVLPWLMLVAYGAGLRGSRLSVFFGHPAIYLVGGMCYTIYLWHTLVVGGLGRVAARFVHFSSHGTNVLVMSVVLVPMVVALCALLFVLFEKPFMRRDWPQRVWARLTGDGRIAETAPKP